MYMITRTIN